MFSIQQKKSDAPSYSVPLSECRWYEGNLTKATLPFRDEIFALQIGSPVLLIEYPDSFRLPKRYVHRGFIPERPIIVPVGHSAETRQEWDKILSHANCFHDCEREKTYSPMSGGMAVIAALILLPLSFFGGLFASLKSEPLLNGWGVPPDISKAIAFSLFVPGCLFFIWWMCMIGTPDAKENIKADIYGAVVSIWFVMLLLVVAPVLIGGGLDWTFNAKIAYTISVILMCCGTTWRILKWSI